MADSKTTKKPAAKKAAPKQAELSLNEQLIAKKSDLLEFRRSLAAGELVNPTVLKTTRKEIARLLTAMRAKAASEKESK